MAVVQTALSLQTSSVRQQLDASVAKESLDAARMEGQMAVQLIQESSVPPPTQTKGNHINIKA
ncbi:MAG: hypothetical protein ACOC2L_03470 [Candidatus Sumerlaeota bacterium]